MDHAFQDKWLACIDDIVFQTDRHLTLLFLNAAWKKYTGYAIESSLGKSLLSFLYSSFNQPDQITYALLNRNPQLVLLRHADDTKALYQITIYGEQSSDLLYGVITHQSHYHTSMLNSIRDGVILMDTGGSILSYSQKAETILGYTKEEVLGNSLAKFFSTEDSPALDNLLEEVMQEHVRQFEFCAMHKNGEQIWLDTILSSIYNASGEAVGFLAVVNDVTRKKQIEIKLRKSEELKSAIINALPDLLFVVDKEGVYLEVYAKDENELARPKDELLGKNISEVLPAEVADAIKKSIALNEIHTLEYQLVLHGTMYWFEARTFKSGEDQAIIMVRNKNDEKVASQKLKESEEQYRLLADNAMDIIILTSTDRKIHYASPSLFKVLNIKSTELLQAEIFDHVHPDDRQFVIDSFYQQKKEDYESTLVFRIKNKAGEYIWLHSKSSFIEYDPETQTGKLLTVLRDITEHKKIEISLRESEERYRLIAENATDVITIFDPEVNYVYLSPSVQKILGYTAEEMLQKNVKDIMTLVSYQHALEAHRNRKDPDEIIHTETEYIRKDGTLVWGENTTSTLRDSKGQIIGYLVTTRDIDGRKKAEMALKDNEQKLKEAQKIAKMGSYEHNIETGKSIWSDEMYNLAGVEPTTSINLDFWVQLIHPEDREHVRNHFFANINTHQEVSDDFRIVRPDGKILHVFNVYKLIRNRVGNPVKTVGILQDITDRKKAEERIERQNRELLKLNHELDNLIYSSSHDLRSPLSSALGLLTITQMEKDPQKKEEYLKLMEKSLQRLDNFTRDILDLYKNARSVPELERVDIHQIIKEILEESQFLEDSDKIEKIVNIKQVAPFYSESKRLKIIFSNLISNAIRYHNLNQPHPMIEISGIIDDKQAIIYVKDNGQGIDELHIDKIFDMFYRAHQQKKGSGLGLYLVKETSEKLKGTVNVSSVYGEGTTFTLKLPNLKSNYDVSSSFPSI